MISDLSIIISNNLRSLKYLKVFIKLKIKPKEVIYVNDNKNHYIKKRILKILKQKLIKKKSFSSEGLSNNVARYILNRKEKNFILSLPHGEIIKNKKILKNKNLIHFHPGRLPLFRGATSIYYSLLRKKEICCSTIIMSLNIDGGDILFCKKFPFPKKIKDIDRNYDIKIREICLEYLIKNLKKLKAKPQKKIKKLHYYLAHPVIRKLAITRMKA